MLIPSGKLLFVVRLTALAVGDIRRLQPSGERKERSFSDDRPEKSPIHSAHDDVAEHLPTLAVERGERLLSDRAEVVGRGVDLDAGEQHRQFKVL